MSHPSEANAERFSGFADIYDQYRPRPPRAVVEILTQMAGRGRPRLVVDLGCGTGLSTRIWADAADEVIGIEPSDDMRDAARRVTKTDNVHYRRGFAHATNLPNGAADIVTCSQSLHWMEPGPTFQEVKRILRPGGVFAAIDCDWPPTTASWKVEQAYRDAMARRTELVERLGVRQPGRKWPKEGHLARMQASGCFRHTKELLLHHMEMGTPERMVGIALSMSSMQALLKRGVTESDIGLDRLRATARECFGDAPVPWYFSYRVRIGVV